MADVNLELFKKQAPAAAEEATLRNVVCAHCGSIEFEVIQVTGVRYDVLDTMRIGLVPGQKFRCIGCGWFLARPKGNKLLTTLPPEHEDAIARLEIPKVDEA